jgi:ATP-dependent exoDNAse (exonuclease V) beta subunit
VSAPGKTVKQVLEEALESEHDATIVGRTLAPEVESVVRVVSSVVRHPLIERAARARDLRREVPLTLAAGETLIEGVAYLAFLHDGSWTVVDFKTDAEIGSRLPSYKRQVALYARAIAEATGAPAVPILFRL